jgi:hypothetical protein
MERNIYDAWLDEAIVDFKMSIANHLWNVVRSRYWRRQRNNVLGEIQFILCF